MSRYPLPLGAAIRVGLLGFGIAGRAFHGPFLDASDRFRLDVIVTANPERRAEAQRLHPRADVVPSTDDLFARGADLDLVVVGTPGNLHAEHARRALAAGVATVVDKPFVVTAGDGRELIDLATSTGTPLTVFQNRRWDGDFRTVQRLVTDGTLGAVTRFESRFERWQPELRQRWRDQATPAEGGGILYDLGAHLIDQAMHLLGPVADAWAEIDIRRPGGRGDDDTFVALRHASGARSHLYLNSVAAQLGPRFHVLGTTSAYTSWGLDPQEAAIRGGGHPSDPGFGAWPESRWGVVGVEGSTRPEPTIRGDYGLFYAALADALAGRGPLPVDPADSLAVIELIERLHAEFGGPSLPR